MHKPLLIACAFSTLFPKSEAKVEFIDTSIDLYQNSEGNACRVEPQLENIVNIEAFIHSDLSKSRWPRIQIFKNYEAKIRLDHYTEMGSFGEEGSESDDNEMVTSTYYLKNLQNSENNISMQDIFYDPTFEGDSQFQSISNFKDMTETIF